MVVTTLAIVGSCVMVMRQEVNESDLKRFSKEQRVHQMKVLDENEKKVF